METLPIAPIGRILSNAGAPRATKDAKVEFPTINRIRGNYS